MKRAAFVIGILTCLASALPAPAVDIAMEVTYASSYLWRGFDLNPTRQPVVQPALDMYFDEGRWNLNLWGSLSLTDQQFHEVDVTLTRDFRLNDQLALTAGIIHYGWYFSENFTFRRDTSQEVFVSIGCDSCLVEPRATLFYDFGNGDGFYAQFELGHAFRVSENIDLLLGGSFGYNAGQWLADGVAGGLSDAGAWATAQVNTGSWELAVSLHYMRVLLDALGKDDYLWFSMAVRYRFRESCPGCPTGR